MGRTTRVVNMSVDEGLYEDVERIARDKGTSRSQILREALQQYVASSARWSQLLAWGEDSAERLGVGSDADVERIVHEHRAERR